MWHFSKIHQIIDTFGSHLHIELQQRGVEFSQLFRKYEHMRPALLERMPPMETVRPNATNNPAAMTNGETSEDLDSTGEEGNLHVEARKGFGESEIQDSVSNTSEVVSLIIIISLNVRFHRQYLSHKWWRECSFASLFWKWFAFGYCRKAVIVCQFFVFPNCQEECDPTSDTVDQNASI